MGFIKSGINLDIQLSLRKNRNFKMKTINHLLNILVNILLILLTYFYLKIHYYYYNLNEWNWYEDRYILSLLFISTIFFISITSLFLYSIYKIKKYKYIRCTIYIIYFLSMTTIFILYLPKEYI